MICKMENMMNTEIEHDEELTLMWSVPSQTRESPFGWRPAQQLVREKINKGMMMPLLEPEPNSKSGGNY
jgi:hypothetical protein